VPGPNVLAYEVLQDVTGQNLDPTSKAWQGWWNTHHGDVDVVDHVLSQSRMQLMQVSVRPFEENTLWYLPEGVYRSDLPYTKRLTAEQNAIGRWRDWVNADVKRYVADWDAPKQFFDRIVHQPDPRVGDYLRSLIADPVYGDYVGIMLAWRGQRDVLPSVQDSYHQWPTVGRALARAAMGDKTALQDLLKMVEAHKAPLSYGLIDDAVHDYVDKLPSIGVVPAEQAFELLAHQRFGLTSAVTASEKKKALKKAQRWLSQNLNALTLDPKHEYYVQPAKK
jgi:hypothetical protein